jgi:hypothetical protein
MTEIYHISDEGIISLHASYSQEPYKALKCAVLQLRKNWNTWTYRDINIPIKSSNGRLVYYYGDNQALFTRKV